MSCCHIYLGHIIIQHIIQRTGELSFAIITGGRGVITVRRIVKIIRRLIHIVVINDLAALVADHDQAVRADVAGGVLGIEHRVNGGIHIFHGDMIRQIIVSLQSLPQCGILIVLIYQHIDCHIILHIFHIVDGLICQGIELLAGHVDSCPAGRHLAHDNINDYYQRYSYSDHTGTVSTEA